MKIQDIINKASELSKSQGWNEIEDIRRTAMLVITELSEAVQAHRKSHYADIVSYVKTQSSASDFETYIKDSVEDELADVVIRVCSFLGQKSFITTDDTWDEDLFDLWSKSFEEQSFASNALSLTETVIKGFSEAVDYSTLVRLVQLVNIWSVQSVIKSWSLYRGYNLEWHIMEKIKYNESRGYKTEY